jgi:hypothetical protein
MPPLQVSIGLVRRPIPTARRGREESFVPQRLVAATESDPILYEIQTFSICSFQGTGAEFAAPASRRVLSLRRAYLTRFGDSFA